MSTPHIQAKKSEIAKTVFLAGDPKRAEFIAKKFLQPGYKKVNNVRNMWFFTGKTKVNGKRVTVGSHGMGFGSVGIYFEELFNHYGVNRIIRLGSAGSYQKEVNLYDVVIGQKAWTESNFGEALGFKSQLSSATPALVKAFEQGAKEEEITYHKGNIHSSATFYNKSVNNWKKVSKEHNLLCVEMEASILYIIAKKYKKEALCVLTVSDSLVTHEKTSSDERQKKFTNMMEVAFKTLV